MVRKFLGAIVLLLGVVSVLVADEYAALITRVQDDNVSFHKIKFNKEEKKLDKVGAELTLPAGKAKVVLGKFNQESKKFEAGEEVPGGLKADKLAKLDDKGVKARIITDSDNKTITEIRLIEFKKKDNK